MKPTWRVRPREKRAERRHRKMMRRLEMVDAMKRTYPPMIGNNLDLTKPYYLGDFLMTPVAEFIYQPTQWVTPPETAASSS